MYRARQKLYTGCWNCRNRRKKCDELKPKCGSCLRMNLNCQYPANLTTQSQSTERILGHGSNTLRTAMSSSREESPASSDDSMVNGLSVARAISPGHAPFRNEHEFTLFRRGSSALSYFTTPIAGNMSRDLSEILCITVSLPWVRDAFTAFGGMITQGDNEDNRYRTILYNSAIHQIRMKLQRNELDGNIQPLLLSITFLGISEGLFMGNADAAINHFWGAMELLKSFNIKLADSSSSSGSSTASILRVVAECLIHNVAVYAISYSNLSRLPRHLPSTRLEKFFATSSELPFEASPFLAGLRDVYYLAYEISVLGRNATILGHHTSSYRAHISNIRRRVNEVDQRVDSLFTTVSDSILRRGYTTLSRLHVAALRIYLEKVGNLKICGTVNSVRSTLRHALELLEAYDFGLHAEITMCVPAYWSLVIFQCAASEFTDIFRIDNAIDNIKHNMTTGHKISIERIQEKVRSVRIDTPSSCSRRKGGDEFGVFPGEVDFPEECTAQHEALGLLVHPQGLS